MNQVISRLWIASSIGLGCLVTLSPSSAQIVPDNTLPVNSSVTPGCTICTIDGGTVRGANLFHSFSEFSIPTGGEAFFNNSAQIQTIFSRVTGSNLSNIDGLIRANGTATLFLLNPNGIIFGPNAQLGIGGSFFASTASSFKFPDGSEFSATNPQAPPLLTVNLTPGLQYGTSPSGNINQAGNLTVASGQTIALYGNFVTSTGSLTAPGGTVMVLGERIGLFDTAQIDVSSEFGGGTVLIGGGFQGQGDVPNAARTFVGSQVRINADGNRNGNGGNVIVWADEATGFYGNISARGGIEAGNGGFVEVSGKQQLIFRGAVNTSAVNGLSGTLLLDPTDIVIANGSGDSAADGTDTFAGNNSQVAGAILSAPLSAINDTAPTTIYESELEGLSGNTNVILQATNDITVNDLADNALKFAAGSGEITLTADADGDGVGTFVMQDIADTLSTNGRDITINGASLTLGNIRTSSVNVNGGTITLKADGNITTGSLNSYSYSDLGNGGNGGAISLFSNSGDITINSFLNSSSSLFSYYGNGGNGGNGGAISLFSNSGNITINSFLNSSSSSASLGNAGNGGTISLSSVSGNITTNSSLNSRSNSSSGNAGNGGAISLSSSGDITVNRLDSFSYSESGNAGNGGAISLSSVSGDIITHGDFNSSSSSLSGNVGNGGAIFLIAKGGDIIGRSTGSLLYSFALSDEGTAGSGGNVTLEAQNNITNLEILTLSSSNQAGEVAINGFRDLSVTNTRILTSRRVEVEVPFYFPPRLITLEVGGQGQSGDVTVTSLGNLTFNNSSIESDTNGSERAGNITLSSPGLVTFNNSQIISNTSDIGKAGDIAINAGGGITFQGMYSYQNLPIRGGLFAGTTNSGNAGTITLTTPELTLQNGANIATTTENLGTAGKIILQSHPNSENLNINLEQGTSISASTNSTFNQATGGTIEIKAPNAIQIHGEGTITTETTGAGQAGNIQVSSRNLDLQQTQLSTSTTATGDAGNITLDTSTLTVARGAKVFALTEGSGDSGTITVNAPTAVNLGLGVNDFSPVLSVETSNAGKAGSIIINTPNLTLSDTARITATATSTATNKKRGGSITLNASTMYLAGIVGVFAETSGQTPAGTLTLKPYQNQSTLNITLAPNSQVSASTSGSGKGGDLILSAPQAITIAGQGRLAVESQSTGDAGNVLVTTPQLTLTDGVELSAAAKGRGNAGEVRLNTQQLTLDNNAQILASNVSSWSEGIILEGLDTLRVDNYSGISASTRTGEAGSLRINANSNPATSVQLSNNSRLSVEATGEGGKAGGVRINAQQLTLNERSQVSASNMDGISEDIILQGLDTLTVSNSLISASTQTGKAGSLTINASEAVDLNGAGGLSVEATEGGTAGNLTVNTGKLSVRNGAQVTVSSPSGLAGNLTIRANSLRLNQGQLTAETGTSGVEGGANITLQDLNTLWMTNESRISAKASGDANGGNIYIDTRFLIVLPPQGANGSDIIASALQGNGGRITIKGAGIFGIQERPAIPGNRTNDIDASSQFGSPGEIQLNVSLDPAGGLVELPTDIVDVSKLVEQNLCKASIGSAFTITGRGGLPTPPTEALNADADWEDWRITSEGEPTQRIQSLGVSSDNQRTTDNKPKAIIEAQGWYKDANGNIILTAEPTTITPHGSWLSSANCQ
jgi:filamentous hemagglutinin family protein